MGVVRLADMMRLCFDVVEERLDIVILSIAEGIQNEKLSH